MLLNLVTNAVKFTPRNGNIEIHVEMDGMTHIKFNVVDSGIGIKQKDKKKLF